MDCSPPGSSVHGILQARVLEWVAIAFSENWGRKENREWLLMSKGFPFGEMKHFGTRQEWWLYNTMNVLYATELYILDG